MSQDKQPRESHRYLHRMGITKAVILISVPVILFSFLISIGVGLLVFGHITNEFIVTPLIVSAIVSPILTYYMLRLIFQLDDAREKLSHMVMYDSLTGLYNRGHFITQSEKEMTRARRYEKIFSLCMMDIDNFKQVNDEYGHLVGDAVLRHLADACLRCCRSIDLVGRFGGDEFVMLLLDTDKQGTEQILQRIHDEVRDAPEPESGVKYTLSIGAVVAGGAEQDLDELLAAADSALYAVKHKGRNGSLVY
jgi:diguanylate cyclase (GGDEF)-like protein